MGTLAWEAKLELEKLPRVLRERMDRLASGRLDPDAAAALQAEIDDLGRQLETHKRTLADMEAEPGRGYVAADARDQAIIDKTGGAKDATVKLLKRTDVPVALLNGPRRARGRVPVGQAGPVVRGSRSKRVWRR